MSAPVIWIILPGMAGIVLYFFRKWHRAIILAGIVLSLGLAWLAWKIPLNQAIDIGPWTMKIDTTLSILGRRLVLTDDDRPILTVIYLVIAYWFGGAATARVTRLFVPASLGIVALMTATLAVDPFLYAALFIEITALVCVLLLVTPQKPAGRGVLRFLTYQTLGVPFLLFTGWLLAEMQVNGASPAAVLRATVLVALGFGFLLGVFPFHTWLPMVSDESHPYSAAFVFFIMPGMTSLFAYQFLQRNGWLGNPGQIIILLRTAGGAMIALGGIWAAFQRHLGRMMAYAVICETGLILITLESLAGGPAPKGPVFETLGIFFSLFISRGLALGVWALALSAFRAQAPDLRFQSIQGLGRRLPVATAALVIAHFSMAGFPLLAGFSPRLDLLSSMGRADLWTILLVFTGSIGLMVGGLRSLSALVMGTSEERWLITENRSLLLFLFTGIAILIFSGLFPIG
jgi:NADH-quinone oxidoreductase subunit N